MTYNEAVEYMNSTAWFGGAPGLDRIKALTEAIGSPQKRLRFVHIAGTNGKGSCAAMTASVLRAAGYKTGLFTSPYLCRFNERMQVNGEQISDEALTLAAELVKKAADAMEDKPTAFELMTAAAFAWFAAEECDIVVLEAGLGGRLDATNIIDAPEAEVIMNIGLDHTAVLGDTVEKIAAEKAGIIKAGTVCVSYQQEKSVSAVLRAKCDEVGAKLVEADFAKISPEFDSLEGQVFVYKDRVCAIPLLGAHQQKNAAVVTELIDVLRKRGWKIDDEAVEHGLYAVSWPGRFEVLSDDPYFVVDGGHNPQCAAAVADNLKRYFPNDRRVLLLGFLKDKDYKTMLGMLLPLGDAFVCVTPDSPRALPAEELRDMIDAAGKPARACYSIRDAVTEAVTLAENGMVCACGSLYTVGEIRACFDMR